MGATLEFPDFHGRLITDPADMAPFLTDWRRMWRGSALAVAQPDDTAGVATLIGWCNLERIAVVPQGGNTGLSGGATPAAGGRSIVLSLRRMQRIRSVDAANGSMVVEAGCTLAAAQKAADDAERYFPLSLAAEGSCTIGGNLATNAGGTAALRYGSARDLCLGLEVVTAQGEVWTDLRALRKNNTGYDLRHLMIGSEGTLGVITAASLRLFPKPVGRACAILAVASAEDAHALFSCAMAHFDARLTAVELISGFCMDLVRAQRPASHQILEKAAPWYVLIEVSAPEDDPQLRRALEAFLIQQAEHGLVQDGAIAQSTQQAQEFWAVRELISDAQAALGPAIKHDISLPLSSIPAFLKAAGDAVSRRWPDSVFVIFGHLGDGNLHYNFSPAAGMDHDAFLARQSEINALVHGIVAAYGGSISAEHGLGVLRHIDAARLRSPAGTAMMRAIKSALDPQNIMNPGKVLP